MNTMIAQFQEAIPGILLRPLGKGFVTNPNDPSILIEDDWMFFQEYPSYVAIHYNSQHEGNHWVATNVETAIRWYLRVLTDGFSGMSEEDWEGVK